MNRAIWFAVGVSLLGAASGGCTSEDIFHDTDWKTACDVDANTPGCRDSGGGSEGGTEDAKKNTGANVADAGNSH